MTFEGEHGQWELGDALRGNTVNHTVAVPSCKDRSKFTDTIGRPPNIWLISVLNLRKETDTPAKGWSVPGSSEIPSPGVISPEMCDIHAFFLILGLTEILNDCVE